MAIPIEDWNPFLPRPVESRQPGPGEVHLYAARVPANEAALAEISQVLNAEERARAEKFKASEPRRQFVFGRVVLRQILGACLQVPPASLAFGHQPAGKPFLLPPAMRPDLRFNLSHSGDLVAVAVSGGREVGVDLEWIHGLGDWADLGARIFSARELAGLYALPPGQHRQAFFNGWTRKEAWLKATGQGLIDDLPAIEVTLAPGDEAKWLNLPGGSEAMRQWSVQTLPLPADYAGAVVVQSRSVVEAWNPKPVV